MTLKHRAPAPIVVGLSGSSGAQYGVRLPRVLHEFGSHEVHQVLSGGAEKTQWLEAGVEPSDLYPWPTTSRPVTDIRKYEDQLL